MCGISAYIGKNNNAAEIVFNMLSRLEYRGYDSAGIAYIKKGKPAKISVVRDKGMVEDVKEQYIPEHSDLCIGHTRWATHGEPSKINAHPHLDCKQEIAIVHNGIIENYIALKKMLEDEGHKFVSATDSEVLAHLIEKFYDNDNVLTLEDAVRQAIALLRGSYGIAVISSKEEKIVAARLGSPIIVGIGKDENEYFVSSDTNALLPYTNSTIPLNDGEIAILTKNDCKIINKDAILMQKKIEKILYNLQSAEKGEYAHYMLKEIFEQPRVINETMRGRLRIEEGIVMLGGVRMKDEEIRSISRIVFIACGTSLHAGMLGKYLIEEIARIPAEAEYASEFKYKFPVLDKNTLVIAISQSGETADTIASLREARARGANTIGIVNVVGSTIAREAEKGIYVYAGPEIGVASTKAFTAQVTALYLLSLYFGRIRNTISGFALRELVEEFARIPEKVQKILDNANAIKDIADEFYNYRDFLYLGRGYNFPVALEGALKLKEISYIHAEGYPAGEMKHGPIAMIDEGFPTMAVLIKDNVYNKIMSNVEEIKARHGRIAAITTEGDDNVKKILKKDDKVMDIPETLPIFYPFLTVVPLQLFAYFCALKLGKNVDKPRNLAKSVTVE
ncbi:MAG: glutamine--fructose-6-phosphate transaminase (isomerizing) [Candidatus Altiarchaeum hamiconexum]|uniref:Glutamine--fructose-6-phosphate aminotransferase [isomerizing] n=1 Tax=Candidatus Altarchaeum hamiconexum TaxID=1803513 RepID=A0A8J7YXQ8_9ARCH|nr:glutamine--fructose-6-phosphate transaminase (isomerizing) [Candidatus Altarchaeum hamiconexum]OIQ05536.1 MAG: glutamine--fructose-6-phosphate aminotransferase [Candidatus Altarchaeum sp. CG2_30_32_3053]PIN67278.1 MAG: glutamine--fructose-6-phosphate transaminase (isomerizing) [Candidatus Altarchaeum sp. CG12_big_fil_rev_8_21_14_0_65_33_22]PIV27635.1 MAG: glutamine--fructose-6-phosphate transaminase (isomerizing) [Candidatus Altarchaeum sp. CG03_land_8_20_14_0_80_32_618]PIX48249.1 MAG: gluta